MGSIIFEFLLLSVLLAYWGRESKLATLIMSTLGWFFVMMITLVVILRMYNVEI